MKAGVLFDVVACYINVYTMMSLFLLLFQTHKCRMKTDD